MKNLLSIFALLFCILYSIPLYAKPLHSKELDEILSRLDNKILQQDEYRHAKEERIKMLSESLNNNESKEARYHTNRLFYEEYYVYNADSAMQYVEENLKIASELKRKDWFYTWRINKSFLLSATGLLKEAEDVIKTVPSNELSDELLIDYYGQMMYLWSHFGQYAGTQQGELQKSYLDKERLYRDSIYSVLIPTHPLYLWYKGCSHQLQGEEAMRKVIPELRRAVEASHLDNRYDAMNAYILANICRDLGETQDYIKYLAYSSIADIVSCNKDIASLEELAVYLFQLGDIDRAYSYLSFCLQNTLFYKNRVRVMDIAEKMDDINAVYKEREKQQNFRLQFALIVLSVMSVILFFSIIYILKKHNQLRTSRTKLQEMNKQLNSNVEDLFKTHELLKEANEKFQSLNLELKDVNSQLRESNYEKEEYIGYVFSLCSNYISKMDEYRKNINRKLKTNQLEEAKALTDRPTMAQNELKEFYKIFDAIFLHVYPNFVSDFNALLNQDEQIVLKEGELLNTELRIYALVRLGINDSVKIAEFLHCSPQTVYNNRLKVRNKSSIVKGKFAETVRSLGKNVEL